LKKNNLDLKGVIVPIVTPVDENGGVDFDGLEKLADWLAGKGIQGIFAAGTTGRFSHFSPEQNAEICRAVSNAVKGRILVYGGGCDSGLHRILANAERMKKAGADAVVATAPYYLSYSIEEAEADLEKIAEKSPLPVVYYNIPEFVGYGLRPEWLEMMADHPNAAGYKDSSNDLGHHLDVLKRTKGKDFDVLIGKELLLAQAFKNGAKGLVVSFANAFPEPFVELCENADRLDWEAVDVCQNRAADIVADFLSRRKGQVFSALMHYLEGELQNRGINIKLF